MDKEATTTTTHRYNQVAWATTILEEQMDLKHIQKIIKQIKNQAGDDEGAHSLEDDLYHNFIEWLSQTRKDDIGIMAKEIIKTEKIDFARWCA